ncbi:hypothetical protein HA402_013291 [Bradysia odoriphaga]|nr:hypothetical protein HA402_013291 [Bradysia odoriphaga]
MFCLFPPVSRPGAMNLLKDFDEDEEERAPLPPEMFVPNQQRWLELRARNTKSAYCLCLCNDTKTIIEE